MQNLTEKQEIEKVVKAIKAFLIENDIKAGDAIDVLDMDISTQFTDWFYFYMMARMIVLDEIDAQLKNVSVASVLAPVSISDFLYDSCGDQWLDIEAGDEVQETITPDYFDQCESLLGNNDKTFTVGDKSFTVGIDFVTDDDQIVIYIVRKK